MRFYKACVFNNSLFSINDEKNHCQNNQRYNGYTKNKNIHITFIFNKNNNKLLVKNYYYLKKLLL